VSAEPPAEVRVILVDDHAALREPLAYMLGLEPDIVVVGQADSLEGARSLLDETGEVDVAIVDLDLPDGSGIDFIGDLRVARPRAMVLILTAFSRSEQLAEAIEAGASGIAHKSTRPQDVVEAVRRLYTGEQLLSQREITDALRLVFREREKNRDTQLMVDRLTPREHEVLQTLAEGFSSDREIAERLFVGTGTAHTHVVSILSKLEVQSRLQALVLAARHGIVNLNR
jgi:two-component system nitrate/nitrite response regulator NarL